MRITVNFADFPFHSLAGLERTFLAYATSQKFRPSVKDFFFTLSAAFEAARICRLTAEAPILGQTEILLPTLPDFTAAELRTLRGVFAGWRDKFSRINSAVAALLNDIAGLLDDRLRERERSAKQLEAAFSPFESEAFWGE